MEPTAREQYNQRTAQLLVLALQHTNPASMTIHPQIVMDSESGYCNKDYTKELCAVLRESGDAFIYADPKNRELRDLATWWEDHQNRRSPACGGRRIGQGTSSCAYHSVAQAHR